MKHSGEPSHFPLEQELKYEDVLVDEIGVLFLEEKQEELCLFKALRHVYEEKLEESMKHSKMCMYAMTGVANVRLSLISIQSGD